MKKTTKKTPTKRTVTKTTKRVKKSEPIIVGTPTTSTVCCPECYYRVFETIPTLFRGPMKDLITEVETLEDAEELVAILKRTDTYDREYAFERVTSYDEIKRTEPSIWDRINIWADRVYRKIVGY